MTTSTTASILSIAGLLAAAAAVGLPAIWGGLALWYRLETNRKFIRVASLTSWCAVNLAALQWLIHAEIARGLLLVGAGWVALLAWWVRLRPANDGDWADDVAQMAFGAVTGNRVTLHNVRNFDWRSATDYLQRWETRVYDLDRLQTVDMIMSYWRGPSIAHMLISFGFAGGGQVVFSVEIRRKRTQQFSELGGFFKEFELSIIAADELDVVWLRTNVRRERVHVYALQLAVNAMRLLFLGYVEEANRLVVAPRFYNTITVNCTTLVYQMMRRIVGRLPLSYRLLFSGYMPEYVYSVGGLNMRYSLDELRSLGFASERAQRCERSASFSAHIRQGMPGRDTRRDEQLDAPAVPRQRHSAP